MGTPSQSYESKSGQPILTSCHLAQSAEWWHSSKEPGLDGLETKCTEKHACMEMCMYSSVTENQLKRFSSLVKFTVASG